MGWRNLWPYYLILFITVVMVAGANLWAWKRERNWRWWRDGVASVIILGMVLAILLPVMTPRPGWYTRNDVLAITFSPDGRLLAFQTRNGDVTLQDAATGRKTHHFRMAAAPPIWPRPAYAFELARRNLRHSLLFSPDGRLLAAGWVSGRVCVWNAATGVLEQDLNAETPAQPLAFTPDGKRLLVGDYIGHVNTWDVSTVGHIVRSTTVASVNAGPADMAFSPAGLLTVVTGTGIQ